MNLPSATGIYRIRSMTTGKCYIGSAKRLNVRRNAHFYLLRNGRHHSPMLQNAWNKYGESDFVVEIVEFCSAESMRLREQWWLDNSNCVYNVSAVATTPVFNADVAKKIGEASARKGERFLVRGQLVGVSKIYKLYGVRPCVFYQRLARGWDVERAATTRPDELRTAGGARVHEYNGGVYTLAELVKFSSCSKTTLFRRIKSGMSVKDAVEMTKQQSEAVRIARIVKGRWGHE